MLNFNKYASWYNCCKCGSRYVYVILCNCCYRSSCTTIWCCNHLNSQSVDRSISTVNSRSLQNAWEKWVDVGFICSRQTRPVNRQLKPSALCFVQPRSDLCLLTVKKNLTLINSLFCLSSAPISSPVRSLAVSHLDGLWLVSHLLCDLSSLVGLAVGWSLAGMWLVSHLLFSLGSG